MKVLVASLRHHLFPLAHRLRREGCDVEALAWRSRYEGAWDGSLRKAARHSDGTLNPEALSGVLDAANRGEVTVLTDVRRVAERFAAAPRLFGTLEAPHAPTDPLLLGGWFTGESVQAPHLLVADHGVQAGGLGAPAMGGLTLIRTHGDLPSVAAGPVAAATERLKRAGFRGLFHLEVREDAATGEMQLGALVAGWPWLHTQAFCAELASLRDCLEGTVRSALGDGRPELKKRFVTVLPVTVPPWPSEKTAREPQAGVVVEGLTAQQQGQLYWFDMRVNARAKRLETAGLDGLLAVATGASDSTPALARARALELAQRLQVPGKQFRPDTGATVDATLATLEDRWGFVPW